MLFHSWVMHGALSCIFVRLRLFMRCAAVQCVVNLRCKNVLVNVCNSDCNLAYSVPSTQPSLVYVVWCILHLVNFLPESSAVEIITRFVLLDRHVAR